MTLFKKSILLFFALVMALGMTAGFTACGGSSGGGDVKGDELQAGGWTWQNLCVAYIPVFRPFELFPDRVS